MKKPKPVLAWGFKFKDGSFWDSYYETRQEVNDHSSNWNGEIIRVKISEVKPRKRK